MDLLDCRDCYDNDTNMSGKFKDVQSRLLEMNKKALFIPCNTLTWNLTLVSVTFCGVVNGLYTLFSALIFR